MKKRARTWNFLTRMNGLEKQFCAGYAVRGGEDSDLLLLSMPREEITALCRSMIHQMLTDKNSGHLRERVTLELLGLEQNPNKLGYDSTAGQYEVKPTNVARNGKRKLTGQGTITDHRWQRHKKFLEEDVKLLVSGWVDGQILYILEVDYKDLCARFESCLTRHLPDGDVKNRYVRSADFSYSANVNTSIH